jgi:hypothetical protein
LPCVQCARRSRSSIVKVKQRSQISVIGGPEGRLSRWSWLHLQSLASTNPHRARVMAYDLFLCLLHKEGLGPSTGDINRLIDDSKILFHHLSLTYLCRSLERFGQMQ